MKHFHNYDRVIAISEKSNGNESVGSMWLETKSFHKNTPVSEILDWSKGTNGKLIITIDEDTVKDNLNF